MGVQPSRADAGRSDGTGTAKRAGAPQAVEGAMVAGSSALGWSSLLAEVPLFGALSKRHLRHVVSLVELRRFRPGATVVRTGGAGNAFYLVLDGGARVEPVTGRGRVLKGGEYFGELALLDGAPRSATVTAVDDLTVGRISRTAFSGLLRREPAVAVGLLRGLVAVVRDLQGAQD